MSRATSFGSAAEDYEAARPGYPAEAADFVLSLAEVVTAIEVGAGTGKTTEAFAREGLSITCLEPDPAMATILRAKSLPGVTVVESTYEEWPGPREPVDLVFAGQVWHWPTVRPRWRGRATGYGRAGSSPSSGTCRRTDTRFGHIYRQHAPQLLDEGTGGSGSGLRRLARRPGEVRSQDVRLTVFTWHADLDPTGSGPYGS